MEGKERIEIGELDPTFLFTWKGIRRGQEESYHSHDYPELAFVLSGQGKYHIEGKQYEVQAGDLLILNPGVRHQALVLPDCETPATEFFVGFSDIKLEGFPDNSLPVPEKEHMLHTAGELRQRLLRLCTLMEAENNMCKAGRYYMLKAYLMQMILLVIREQCQPADAYGGYAFESVHKKYVVEQIISYFEEHYSEKISLDQIAGNMYLSPFYISKLFKSETGDTPIRYLINIRLEMARGLLEQGRGASIQEVAAAVGYDDAYHFSKLFKKRYGITPSQVRKAAAGKKL